MKKKWICQGMALVFIFGMAAAAELFSESEIIFPEILAVLIGAWVLERQPWNVSRPRMVFGMTAAAVAGIGICALVPLPLYGKVMLGLALTAGLLLVTQTGMVPMVSACILPIMMGTESPVYPVSVFILVSLAAVVQLLMEKAGIRAGKRFVPAELSAKSVGAWLLRLAVLAVLLAAPLKYGMIYMAAPPLLVIFLEFCEEESKMRARNREIGGLIAAGTTAAVCLRLFWVERGWFSLSLAAVFAAVFLFLLMNWRKCYFPPLGAMVLLPMILPAEGLEWYPVQVMAGFIAVTGVTVAGNKGAAVVSGWLERSGKRDILE